MFKSRSYNDAKKEKKHYLPLEDTLENKPTHSEN